MPSVPEVLQHIHLQKFFHGKHGSISRDAKDEGKNFENKSDEKKVRKMRTEKTKLY